MWLTPAEISNSTETPTMRGERMGSMLWPALERPTAGMIAYVPEAADPKPYHP